MKKYLLFLLPIFLLTDCADTEEIRSLSVDINKTKEPINALIFGQFIEHLGRCIYGGIWAEMIEDRKFYYPINYEFDPWAYDSSEYWNTGPFVYLNGSPWEVIGEDGTVEMDKTNPYAGDHAPLIKVPGDGTLSGIQQGRLALELDKSYEGNVVLRGQSAALPITLMIKGQNKGQILVQINNISEAYTTYAFNFSSSIQSDSATLQIFSSGNGTFQIGTVSLMPSDHINGWRKDVVELMRELNAPIYRWPGGNFVSGYDWRDGVGDRDQRPPRKNPAWKGVESNDVGIHEYMDLMKILNAEPFIAVNTGLGKVDEVMEEIEYVRGKMNTKMGQWRAQNGHPEPFEATYWAVGNEMYGSWQLGHMPLSEYVKKHNQVAETIWSIDPEAQLVAVGAVGEWSQTMMSSCADHMNLISEHIYRREKEDVEEHIAQLALELERVADEHRKYRIDIPGLPQKDIRIAMDEWNYWYGDYLYGELGVRYHHKDGLGIAKGLHAMFRNSDMYTMANYAQTVNVIGCIKTTKTKSALATTGLPLKLYRNHFESIPVEIVQDSILDVSASVSEDGSRLTIAFINPTNNTERIGLDFGEVNVPKTGKQFIIQNDDPEAYNEPGQPEEVAIKALPFTWKRHQVDVPNYAIVMLEFDLR